jgi:hypothetical protein
VKTVDEWALARAGALLIGDYLAVVSALSAETNAPVIDRIAKTGNPYDPKLRGGILIVPVLPGAHTFTLRALEQPPIFRNWQAWPEK